MAVFCNKCGKDLLEQARYCPFCGVVSKRTVDGSIAFVEPEQGPFCPACGKRTMEDSKHCMWCGLDLHARPEGAGALLCPGCGEKNPEDAGFCSRCRMDFGKWFVGAVGEARILGGRYRLDEELGRGGMGVVYRGMDTELDLTVAVKMVPSELARNRNAVATLKKEAKVAIQLTHPNINRLYTFAQTGKEAFLVMEYVPGRTLEDMLQQKGPPPEAEVVKIGIAILKGLAEAHKRGVIHRDLKPANIMLSSQGEVKILDFGIARVLKETMTRFSQQVSSSSGTLLYMSPEQVKGKRETAESDLYSFAAMLYELLSGNPPFFRGALEHQILNEIPEPLEGISPWLNDVILRCLSKEPERRYASAKELAAALKAGGSKAPRRKAVAPPPPPVPRSSAPVAQEPTAPGGISAEEAQKRKKLILYGGLALALVLVGTLGWYVGVEIPRTADEAACNLAKKVESKAGWQAYLTERPEGLCAGEALESLAVIEKRQDEAACGRARKANDQVAWQAYLKGHPGGGCKQEAERRLAELAKAERERLARIEAESKAKEEDAKRKSAEQEARRKVAEEDAKKKKKAGTQPRWVYSRPAGIRFTKSEVTVAQYRACVEAGKCTKPNKGEYCNWGRAGRDRHPINCVDWNQAKSYCSWVGGRLPTEKEWEAEASNKGSRKYPWGEEEVSCDRAIWGDGNKTDGCGRNRTWPVCSKPRGNSVSGLCDMSGNLWEWTSSLYKAGSSARVLRGGSWDNDDPDNLRASCRVRDVPTSGSNLIGFRCGRSSR